MFTGSWDANAIKEALGDNMGVTSLPTYTINGEEKQMLAYAGSKAIGVNAHSEYMEQAVALAVYLGGSDAQRAHYKMRTVIPCNTELFERKKNNCIRSACFRHRMIPLTIHRYFSRSWHP